MRDDRTVLPARPRRRRFGHVLQLTDTHLSAVAGLPASLRWLLGQIADDPPDLVALTGDIVYEDPDDDDDRASPTPCSPTCRARVVAIPGNHDIGFYGEEQHRPAGSPTFVDTWGSDRFALDAAGWRLVGANAYLLGDPDHDRWLRDAVAVERPVAVFIHQPVATRAARRLGDATAAARTRSTAAVDGADVRLIASGHRHCYADRGRDVWAPSTTILGETSRRRRPTRRSAPSSSRSTRDGTLDVPALIDSADPRIAPVHRSRTGSAG